MNIYDFDLNLLAAFDAVFEERHVSRAADRVGLSQPAMSNALRRLRAALDDPLFVKTKTGVTPTPYAAELAPAVSQALKLMNEGLQQAARFDAAKTTRTFRLAMADVAEVSILPEVIDVCRRTAPGVRFETRALTRSTLTEDLETGAADLAIGFLPDMKETTYQQTLFTTEYVCLARRDHPAIGARLTRKAFLAADHVTIAPDVTGHAVVPKTLDELGVDVSVRAPHFLALPFIVARTDYLAVAPKPLAFKAATAATGLAAHVPPVPLPPIDVRMFWHERAHKDPASRWLRKAIREAFTEKTWD